jgi:hypothetical protein
MDYFSRKSLSKHLMDTIDFNKHDRHFHKGHVAKEKYADDCSKLQGYLKTLLLINEKVKSTFTR